SDLAISSLVIKIFKCADIKNAIRSVIKIIGITHGNSHILRTDTEPLNQNKKLCKLLSFIIIIPCVKALNNAEMAAPAKITRLGEKRACLNIPRVTTIIVTKIAPKKDRKIKN